MNKTDEIPDFPLNSDYPLNIEVILIVSATYISKKIKKNTIMSGGDKLFQGETKEQRIAVT